MHACRHSCPDIDRKEIQPVLLIFPFSRAIVLGIVDTSPAIEQRYHLHSTSFARQAMGMDRIHQGLELAASI